MGVLESLPALGRSSGKARKVVRDSRRGCTRIPVVPEPLTRLMTSRLEHATKGVICLTQYQTPGSRFLNFS